MNKYLINVARDSVCAGDDIDAPHAYTFSIVENALLGDVFTHLATESYLPLVAGVNHYWEAIIDIKVIAAFKGNSKVPESSGNLQTPVSGYINAGKMDIYFKYHSAPD